MTASTVSRKRVLIVEPQAAASNVFSAFAGLPLMGPLLMGTVLKQAGFDVTVVSENLLGRPLGIHDMDHDFLLVSCLTPTVERGFELAALFKRRNARGQVIMGGPHVSFLPEEALSYADHVVTGEGENVIVDLLRHGADERVVQGTPVQDLDTLPLVDWQLLVNWERQYIQPIMLSRGCPFGCNFCSVTAMFGRGYRTVSVDRALEEIGRTTRNDMFFYDDNFTANPKRSRQILEGMARLPRRPRSWSAQVRTDLTRDRELMGALARAGCGRVYVGLESVNDETLAELHKSQTLEDVRRAVRVFHEHGIAVHGMFMFGADADGPEVLRATGDFVRREHVDSVQYLIATPFPGTEYYRRLEAEGRLLHKIWRYYDAMHVVFRPRQLSPLQLQELAMAEYGDFYTILQALNEGLETALEGMLSLLGRSSRTRTPSLINAALKVMGSRIVRKWNQGNVDYMNYLRTVPDQAVG
ncbi:MAG TPA: radical SAM protein [Polyangia bacterium]|jgi:radical SAM superfamily enzyme YgiQ (UPF0313 family)